MTPFRRSARRASSRAFGAPRSSRRGSTAPDRASARGRTRAAARAAAAGTSTSAGRPGAGRARSSTGAGHLRRQRVASGARSCGTPPGLQSKTRCGAAGSACATASRQPGCSQRRGRDEHAAARPLRPRLTRERHVLDGGEALLRGRRLELAERPHLRRRRERTLLLAREDAQLLRRRQRAVPLEQPLDEVHLRLRERRVDPDAARRRAVPARRVDGIAPRGAREVRVVEDDPPGACRQQLVERGGELAQRAAALVAVQPLVAARDVRPRQRGSCPRRGRPSRARPPHRAAARARVAPRRARGRGGHAPRRSTSAVLPRRPSVPSRDGARPGSRRPPATATAASRARPARASRREHPRRATSASFRSRRDRRGAARRAASARSRRCRARCTARRRRLSSAATSNGLSGTCTAAIGASSSASSSRRRLTFATPTRRTRPSSTSRASARTDVRHGVRGSGACSR